MITAAEHIQHLTELGLFDIKRNIKASIRRNKLQFNTIEQYLIQHTMFLSGDCTISERVYCLKNNIHEVPRCIICDRVLKYKRAKVGYRTYCSHECVAKSIDVSNKRKLTYINNFGVDNPFKSVDIREQIKNTNLLNHGVEYTFLSTTIQEKITQKHMEKYGVPNPLMSAEVKAKRKQTILRKYEVEEVLQSAKIQDKIKQTHVDRYGVENSNQRYMIDSLPLLNSYDWMHSQYAVNNKTADQISNEMQVCPTTILNYLKKHNIATTPKYQHSYKGIRWLEGIMLQEGIFIQHARNIGEHTISGTKYTTDGYCLFTNTAYEFHGNYWHGNPVMYPSDYINEVVNVSMGELFQRTIAREQKIISAGYNLVVIWEDEFDKTEGK